MKKTKIIKEFIIASILFMNLTSFSYHVDSLFKYLFNREISPMFYNIKVKNDSLFFDGYMVFMINKNPDTLLYDITNEFYICDIFWITKLSDIYVIENHFKYISGNIGYSEYSFRNKSINNQDLQFKYFQEFWDKYESFYELNITKFPFLMKFLTTEIFFKDIIFWSYSNIDSIGYYIFKNSFLGCVLQADYTYSFYKSRIDNIEDSVNVKAANILIPISKTCDFTPCDSIILLSNGFTESSWSPSNLFNPPYSKPYDK